MSTETLRITEIFYSLQGEALSSGVPTIFIRLTGCPLRCSWCDTEYSFHGGQKQGIAEIIAACEQYPTNTICVTGGEPMAQKACVALLRALCDAGYMVSLETSGAIDLSDVDARVSKVMDLKAPGSGEVDRNRWENLDLLSAHDQLKIVLKDRADFVWASESIATHQLTQRCTVFLSPVYGELEPADLAAWLIELGNPGPYPIRLQLQMHKALWGEKSGV